jgi:hypothetical protein
MNGMAPPIANGSERMVADVLNAEGFRVMKRGWPDFLAYDDEGRVRFVEVKPYCTDDLSVSQKEVAVTLAALGIPVELWAGRCLCGRHPVVGAFFVRRLPPMADSDTHPRISRSRPFRPEKLRAVK